MNSHIAHSWPGLWSAWRTFFGHSDRDEATRPAASRKVTVSVGCGGAFVFIEPDAPGADCSVSPGNERGKRP